MFFAEKVTEVKSAQAVYLLPQAMRLHVRRQYCLLARQKPINIQSTCNLLPQGF